MPIPCGISVTSITSEVITRRTVWAELTDLLLFGFVGQQHVSVAEPARVQEAQADAGVQAARERVAGAEQDRVDQDAELVEQSKLEQARREHRAAEDQDLVVGLIPDA